MQNVRNRICVVARLGVILLWGVLGFQAQGYAMSTATGDGPEVPALLVITGASYAADWKEPKLGSYQVLNRGAGGEETHQVRARLERDVLSAKPSAVLIWGHINNVHRAPQGGIEGAKTKAIEDYRAMVEQVRGAGAQVYLATEVTLTDSLSWRDRIVNAINKLRGKQSYASWVNQQVREVNAWLRTYAAEQNIKLLDFEKTVDDGDGFRKAEYTSPDGTHISEAGYAALTKYSQSVIR